MPTPKITLPQLPVVSRSFPKKNNRLEVLDIIKAFALLGIFIVHVIGPFSGWVEYLLPDQKELLPTAGMDVWLNKFAHLLLAEKCRGTFSFLFGLAFYFQLQKAERQGGNFSFQFRKRLALLFVLGLLHAYLLFAGDVLRYYAVCGLLLTVCYKWRPNHILVLGILFLTVLPLTGIILSKYFPYNDLDLHQWREVRRGFMGNSYLELIKVNFFLDWRSQLHIYYKLQFLSVILGQFLLGLWAGKLGVFARIAHYQGTFIKLFWIGLGIGTASFCFTYSLDKFDFFRPFLKASEIADDAFYLIGNQALILCFVCGLTWLFQRPGWQKWLLILAPAGQMSLTNYLMQSIVGALIFYGVGLGYFGRFGPAFSIPLAVALFAGQVCYSRYWLKRFELGPFEWLFRCALTWSGSFKRQPATFKPVAEGF